MPLRAREREHLLLDIEPPFTACANHDNIGNMWRHHDNLSTFSQLALIMLHIDAESCLLSLLSCRMHGCNYAIGYIIKHLQCNFCYHMHKYVMLVPRWHVRTVHGSPYTFSIKPKWRTVVFWFFATRSSAVAYLRTLPPRGHSTLGVPKHCEGFVSIWLRAREDIAHKLLRRSFDSGPSMALRRLWFNDRALMVPLLLAKFSVLFAFGS